MDKKRFSMKWMIWLFVLSATILFSACSSNTEDDTNIEDQATITNTTNDKEDEDGAWKEHTATITLGDSITYEGTGISVSGGEITISEGGDYTISGTLSNGMIIVNSSDKVKLRLNNANIHNEDGPAIYILDAKKAFITMEEGSVNMMSDGSVYSSSYDVKGTIFSNDTLEIKGNGTLNVTSSYSHGIKSDDDIIIENGIINITAATDGLHANDNITISGGTISITAGSDGIESEGDIVIDGGTLNFAVEDDGIHAETTLVINNGELNVNKSYEGLEAKTEMTINGGSINIVSSDDGLNAENMITINGGTLYMNTEGDGIDSNGSLEINGGYILLYSGNSGDGPIDVGDNNTFTVNGGIIIAFGGNMGIQVSESSTQYSLWVSSTFQKDNVVEILNGNDVLDSVTVLKSQSLLFYSSDALSVNGTYEATNNGSSLGSATLSSKSGNIGNMMNGGMGGGQQGVMPGEEGSKGPGGGRP